MLKYVYLKSRKNQRLDVLLNTLFKILRDKAFKRLIQLEEGYVNHKINYINRRHRSNVEVKEITEISNQEWHVVAVHTENAFYSVFNESESCDYKVKCLVCKVCIHMFSCTCSDYLIKHNLCKHIHAVIM